MKTRIILLSQERYSFSHLALASLVAVIVYLSCALIILDPAALWSPDEGVKLLQLRNLRIEDGRLRSDIAYAGQALDPGLDFAVPNIPSKLLIVSGDSLVLERLPIFPLLSLPFYRLAGMPGLYLAPALAGALTAPLALSLLGTNERRRLNWLLAWGLITFGSPVFIYSILFWEHTPATMFAFVGAWASMQLCFEGQKKRIRRVLLAILAAFLLCASAYLRLETLLLSAALLGACWLMAKDQRRWLAYVALALALALLAYGPLHAGFLDGKSLPTNAEYLFRPLAYLKSAGWQALPDLLVGPPEEEGIHPGWVGVVMTVSALVVLAASLWPRKTTAGYRIVYSALAVFSLAAVYFLLTPRSYRSAHGLLFSTPWALLGGVYARRIWSEGSPRTKSLLLTTALGMVAYTVMMIGVRGSSPHGGLEWGARFALPFFPLLAVLITWGWKYERGAARIIASVLICLGFAFQVRGLLTIRQDKQTNAALNRALQTTPEADLVTDLGWLLPNAAPFYPSKAIFSVNTPDEMAAWAERASTQGVHTFDLATLDYAMPAKVKAQLPGYTLRIRELIVIEDLLIFRISLESEPGFSGLEWPTESQTIWYGLARQGYN